MELILTANNCVLQGHLPLEQIIQNAIISIAITTITTTLPIMHDTLVVVSILEIPYF